MCRFALFLSSCAVVVLPGCSLPGWISPLAVLERKLVFQPAPFPKGLSSHPFEDVEFQSEDGTRLHGWLADHDKPIAVALFCHGNAGNIASRAETLKLLNRLHRLSVMTFDYRGYGKSEGSPTEKGVLADARAARKWLAERKGIPEQEIVLMGRSLGGAVAVDLAAKDGARGLVLASTFATLPDVASNAYPLLPASLLMTLRFDSLNKIKHYPGPLLQSHGDRDELVPIAQGKKLFFAAPGRKRFIVIPGGRHNDPQSIEYRAALDEFLQQL